jgi:methionyl aminopeptidase
MRRGRNRSIEVKTPAQLAVMREAGLVVAAALRATAAAVEPGISTAELDAIAERVIRGAGAVPSFQGYHGFPATICTSVNDQVVHGIPSPDTRLAAGDLISIDCGAIVGGWHGDAALTLSVGPVGAELEGLLAACEQALWHGLARAVAGARLTDISAAVEAAARGAGPFGIVEDYTGHGIGTQMHMDPPVPNYGPPGRGPVLTEGMALAVEPMLVLGQQDTYLLPDDWTVVTDDGGWAAHFEHTVAITADGPWVLTAQDGGASGLARVRAGAVPASTVPASAVPARPVPAGGAARPVPAGGAAGPVPAGGAAGPVPAGVRGSAGGT